MTAPDPSDETTESDADESTDAATYRVRDGESGVRAVVRAVGVETGTDPLALPPLHSAVAPETVEDVVSAPDADSPQVVSFAYCGLHVTVSAIGEIQLRDAETRPGQ